MKVIKPSPSWPAEWKSSYDYDRLEVYGDLSCRGYAFAYATRQRHTLELVGRAAGPGDRVIDLAAAQGNFSVILAEAGLDVTWNDLRAGLADYVSSKCERGLIHFLPGNIFELDITEPFDVVLAAEVIEHVAHPDLFLKKIAQYLRPGGHAIITTPNGAYFRNSLPKFSECSDPSVFESKQFQPNSDGHIFLFNRREIVALATSAGFELVELRLFNNFLTNGHLKTEWLLRWLPQGFVQAIERLTNRLPRAVCDKIHTAMAVLLRKV